MLAWGLGLLAFAIWTDTRRPGNDMRAPCVEFYPDLEGEGEVVLGSATAVV